LGARRSAGPGLAGGDDLVPDPPRAQGAGGGQAPGPASDELHHLPDRRAGGAEHHQHGGLRAHPRAGRDGLAGYAPAAAAGEDRLMDPIPLLKLAWRSIWRNRRRTLISMSAATFGLVLVIFFSSLMAAMIGDARNQLDTTGMGHVEIYAAGYRQKPQASRAIH